MLKLPAIANPRNVSGNHMNAMKKMLGGIVLTILFGCSNSEIPNTSSVADSNSTIVTVFHPRQPYSVSLDTVVVNKELQVFIQELDRSNLTEIKTVPEIPKYIMAYLDSTAGGFDIASPGEEWQEGCIVQGRSIQTSILDSNNGQVTLTTSFDPSQPLPWRQLVYFGMSPNIALMAYNSGGWGKSEHIMILKLNNGKIISEYHTTVLNEIRTKDAILDFLIA